MKLRNKHINMEDSIYANGHSNFEDSSYSPQKARNFGILSPLHDSDNEQFNSYHERFKYHKISMDDFQVISKLGEGSYSSVYKVIRK